MNAKIEMPEVLYSPAEEWGGDGDLMTREDMDSFLEWAEKEDGWENTDESAAEELNHIRDIAPGLALYIGGVHYDSYHTNCRRFGYVIKKDGDEFKMIDQLDTTDCCDDYIELDD